ICMSRPRRQQSTEAPTWVRPLMAYWISPATRGSMPMAKSISVRMSSKAGSGMHLCFDRVIRKKSLAPHPHCLSRIIVLVDCRLIILVHYLRELPVRVAIQKRAYTIMMVHLPDYGEFRSSDAPSGRRGKLEFLETASLGDARPEGSQPYGSRPAKGRPQRNRPHRG